MLLSSFFVSAIFPLCYLPLLSSPSGASRCGTGCLTIRNANQGIGNRKPNARVLSIDTRFFNRHTRRLDDGAPLITTGSRSLLPTLEIAVERPLLLFQASHALPTPIAKPIRRLRSRTDAEKPQPLWKCTRKFPFPWLPWLYPTRQLRREAENWGMGRQLHREPPSRLLHFLKVWATEIGDGCFLTDLRDSLRESDRGRAMERCGRYIALSSMSRAELVSSIRFSAFTRRRRVFPTPIQGLMPLGTHRSHRRPWGRAMPGSRLRFAGMDFSDTTHGVLVSAAPGHFIELACLDPA